MNDLANEPVVPIFQEQPVIVFDQAPITFSVKHPGPDSLLIESKMEDRIIEFPRQRQRPKGVVDPLLRDCVWRRCGSWSAYDYMSGAALAVEFNPKVSID